MNWNGLIRLYTSKWSSQQSWQKYSDSTLFTGPAHYANRRFTIRAPMRLSDAHVIIVNTDNTVREQNSRNITTLYVSTKEPLQTSNFLNIWSNRNVGIQLPSVQISNESIRFKSMSFKSIFYHFCIQLKRLRLDTPPKKEHCRIFQPHMNCFLS